MSKITKEMLEKAGACRSAVELFLSLFDTEAEVTLENCQKALQAGVDLHWVVSKFRPQELVGYETATAQAMAVRGAAIAPAKAAYKVATVQVRAVYDKAIAQAFCGAWDGEIGDGREGLPR